MRWWCGGVPPCGVPKCSWIPVKCVRSTVSEKVFAIRIDQGPAIRRREFDIREIREFARIMTLDSGSVYCRHCEIVNGALHQVRNGSLEIWPDINHVCVRASARAIAEPVACDIGLRICIPRQYHCWCGEQLSCAETAKSESDQDQSSQSVAQSLGPVRRSGFDWFVASGMP